jgi:putative membrane protein insertion efficiency factor
MFLLEGGCCLAEALGCGPSLVLVSPSLWRGSITAAPGVPGSADAPGAVPGSRTERAVLRAIRAYQTEVSPRRRPCCRYSPTCSNYALGAVQVHGVRHGGWLTLRRLMRCRPRAAGGLDPVPARSAR